jgi:hypothetical protein
MRDCTLKIGRHLRSLFISNTIRSRVRRPPINTTPCISPFTWKVWGIKRNTSVRITTFRTKVWTRFLLNAMQNFQPLDSYLRAVQEKVIQVLTDMTSPLLFAVCSKNASCNLSNGLGSVCHWVAETRCLQQVFINVICRLRNPRMSQGLTRGRAAHFACSQVTTCMHKATSPDASVSSRSCWNGCTLVIRGFPLRRQFQPKAAIRPWRHNIRPKRFCNWHIVFRAQ